MATEDGRQIFGESRIHETLLNMKEDKSLDIVHDMVEAIYNFSNYSKLDDDIVLVCVKRKKPI